MRILSFGEILWDVYPEKRRIGGAPLNFAAHMAKHGHEACMLSAVGKDEWGREACQRMTAWGVSTDLVATLADKQTGRCLVTLDEQSIPQYRLLQDVAYDHIPCEDASAVDADVLYFGTLALRSDENVRTLQRLLANGRFREVMVDVNVRPPFFTSDAVRFAVEQATVLKISSEELPTVAAALDMADFADDVDFVGRLAKQYPRLTCVVITRGADGAYAWDRKSDCGCSCESAQVEVVSTVGAGDSFCAAFLHQYLRGRDLSLCLTYAAQVAGFVVSHREAVPDYTVAADADTFLF